VAGLGVGDRGQLVDPEVLGGLLATLAVVAGYGLAAFVGLGTTA
jgi:hypothetical protein